MAQPTTTGFNLITSSALGVLAPLVTKRGSHHEVVALSGRLRALAALTAIDEEGDAEAEECSALMALSAPVAAARAGK
jgi:hypothetical protein